MVPDNPIPQPTLSAPYAGPHDTDPLTQGELSLLLAIPRAARATPNATLFRLPLGPDPKMGWVDVTCAEVYSIVCRLAIGWNAKLSEILRQRTGGAVASVGPGTTVCILVYPFVHSIFHHLAFWALGCTVQYISVYLEGDTIDGLISQSGCDVVLHAGMDEAWVSARRDRCKGELIKLPDEEYAHRLAQAQKGGTVESAISWPTPRRPTPAVIIHSSASSSTTKMFQFSLYFYTIGHQLNCQSHLEAARPDPSRLKTPYTHPVLLFNPPSWQNFYRYLFVHLTTATPLAFPHIANINQFSSSQFIAWAKGMDAGATVSYVPYIRQVFVDEKDIEFFKGLYSISISGSVVDDWVSEMFEKSELPLRNILGMSEFNRLLYTSSAPYNVLRPYPDLPPPLVFPLSEYRPDGSRDVQLWSSLSTSPHLAHLVKCGGVPLSVKPFPGKGPHHGELAMDWGDVFREVPDGPSGEVGYVHIGRSDERIRLLSGKDFNTALYENQLRSAIESSGGRTGWIVDALQAFGSNMPFPALVIQLRRQPDREFSGQGLESDVAQLLSRCVEEVNTRMNLGILSVNSQKRTLIIAVGEGAYGPGVDRLPGVGGDGSEPRLMLTHKHSLRRWMNLQIFRPWLDGLDYSEL